MTIIDTATFASQSSTLSLMILIPPRLSKLSVTVKKVVLFIKGSRDVCREGREEFVVTSNIIFSFLRVFAHYEL